MVKRPPGAACLLHYKTLVPIHGAKQWSMVGVWRSRFLSFYGTVIIIVVVVIVGNDIHPPLSCFRSFVRLAKSSYTIGKWPLKAGKAEESDGEDGLCILSRKVEGEPVKEHEHGIHLTEGHCGHEG